MDFKTLSRRQLQSLCKKNKIPANITNVAMADALTALQFVEGIEEILNSEIPQSPMVPRTGGRTRTAKVVGVSATSSVASTTTRRRAAAASTSTRRKIKVSSNKSLDEIEDMKSDVSVKTPGAAAGRRRGVRETSIVKPVYSTRRSARLSGKIEEAKEITEAIKIDSFAEEIDENVEVEMKESSVDQSEISEITVLDNSKNSSEETEVKNNDESEANSEEKSDIPNGDVAVASIEQRVAGEINTDTDEEEDGHVDGLVKEEEAIKIESFTEEIDENVEVEIKENSVDLSDISEKTVLENSKNSSEEIGVKSTDELEANSEEKSDIPNGDVAVASIEQGVASNIKIDTDQEEDGPVDDLMKEADVVETTAEVDEENEGSEVVQEYNDPEMYSNLAEENKASAEDTEMKFNVDEEAKGCFEVGEINSNVDEDAKASPEKDTEFNFNVEEGAEDSFEVTEIYSKEASAENTEMKFNVDEEAKDSFEVTEINSNVDDETKASTEKETEMNFNVDEEVEDSFEVSGVNSNEDDGMKASIEENTAMKFKEEWEIIAEFKVVGSGNVENEQQFYHDEYDKEHEAYAEDIKNDGKLAQEEFCDVGKDKLVDDKYNLEFGFSDDVSATEFNKEEMTVLENILVAEVEIQEGHEESGMSDENVSSDDGESDMSDENETSDNEESDMSENETSDNEESDMSDGDELVDDKDNLQSDFADDFSVTVFNQDEMAVSEDIVVPTVQIQAGDEESDMSDENKSSGDEESDMSENETSGDEESDMSENETSDNDESDVSEGDKLVDDIDNLESDFAYDVSVNKQEEMAVSEDIVAPKVEIQDELLNSEAKPESEFSAIGDASVAFTYAGDQVQIVAPLINDDDVSSIEPLKKSLSRTPLKESANIAPKPVKRLTKISDDKENVDSGRKSVILKDGKQKLDDYSIRKLSKMLQEKLNISKQKKEDNKEDEDMMMKATSTRPALKTLSENCMGV